MHARDYDDVNLDRGDWNPMILAVESAKGHIRLQFFNEVAVELMIKNLRIFNLNRKGFMV